MSDSNARSAYDARCASVAQAATMHGLRFRKIDGKHELEVSATGGTVVFPIVTDERDWRETTKEEAFYAVLMDVKSWRGVHLDDATLNSVAPEEREEIPLIKQESSAAVDRMHQLAGMLGGDANLDTLLALVDA